jgi:hypothetical protein
LAQQSQAFEVVPQDGVLDPKEAMPRRLHRLDAGQRFLGAPGLVGIHHHVTLRPDGAVEELQAV